MKLTTSVIIVICFILIAVSPSAFAHKVNIYAYVEGDTVFTESYFPDGKKVQNGKVKVYDENGKLLLEGVTDIHGQLNFNCPPNHKLNIVLEASMGHRDEYALKLASNKKNQSANEPNETRIPFDKAVYGIAAIFTMAFFAYYFLKKKKAA